MNRTRRHTSLIVRSVIVGAALAVVAWQENGGHTKAVLAMPIALPKIPIMAPGGVLRHRTLVPPLEPVVPARHGQWVRLRLFSTFKVHSLIVTGNDGLRVGSQVFREGATATVSGGQVRLQIGKKEVSGPLILLTSADQKMMTLKPRHGTKIVTPGHLRLRVRQGNLEVVNVLDLEDYLLGIVEPELGSLNMPEEGIKAQMIAARSYILAVRDRHPGEDYDFCDSAHCQMYTGHIRFPPKFRNAAAACRGLYLRYKNAPAAAFFHHSCGGSTAAIEDVWPGPAVPYLRRVKDSDQEYLGGKGAIWHFSIERKSFMKFLVQEGWLRKHDALENLKVIRTDGSGRAQQILIEGNTQRWVKASTFRNAVNRYYHSEVLLSTLFHISSTGSQIRFEGRGWGHGVGLCQAGAMLMAREGKTYRQILQHYYPGTTIARLPRAPAAEAPPKTTVPGILRAFLSD